MHSVQRIYIFLSISRTKPLSLNKSHTLSDLTNYLSRSTNLRILNIRFFCRISYNRIVMLLLAGSSRQPVGSGNCLFPPAAHAPGTRSFPTRHNPHSVTVNDTYIYIYSVYIVFNVVRHYLLSLHFTLLRCFFQETYN